MGDKVKLSMIISLVILTSLMTACATPNAYHPTASDISAGQAREEAVKNFGIYLAKLGLPSLRRSESTIREVFLKITPVGSSKVEVGKFVNLHNLSSSDSSNLDSWKAKKYAVGKGYSGTSAVWIGGYTSIFIVGIEVAVEWIFDRDGNIREIEIKKVSGGF